MAARSLDEIDVVLSGSGSLLPCHLGVLSRLEDDGIVIRRIGGTSGGAIVAAGHAAGLTPLEQLELARAGLARNSLLDPQLCIWRGMGLHAGNKARAFFRGHSPKHLGGALIPLGVVVTDVGRGLAVYYRSDVEAHASVETDRVVMASAAIPGFFAAQRLSRDDPAWYWDGGMAANFPMDLWDDEPNRRTIGVRVGGRSNHSVELNRPSHWVRAAARILLANANRTHISRKRWADVIRVESRGDALDFSLTASEVDKRFAEGRKAADLWLRAEAHGG